MRVEGEGERERVVETKGWRLTGRNSPSNGFSTSSAPVLLLWKENVEICFALASHIHYLISQLHCALVE